MRCRHARELISLSLDGVLEAPDRVRLLAHLGECRDCQRHREVLERGQQALRTALVEPSENFEWKVQLGIQRALRERVAAGAVERGAPFWRPALVSAASVALLVFGIGSAVLLRGPGTQAPRAVPMDSPARLAESTPVSPDLSGAVRGTPLRVDALSSDFGIRAVGAGTPDVDPRFRGQLFPRSGRAAEVLRVVPEAVSIPVLFTQGLRGDGTPVLHGWRVRATLPRTRAADVDSLPAETPPRR